MQRQILIALLAAGCGPLRVSHAEWAVELRRTQLTLATRGDFHVNPDYPLNFRGPDVRVEREKFTVEEKRAHATVPRRAGVFAFSVCDNQRCLIEKIPLAPK